jgi:hypothetical protein
MDVVWGSVAESVPRKDTAVLFLELMPGIARVRIDSAELPYEPVDAVDPSGIDRLRFRKPPLDRSHPIDK